MGFQYETHYLFPFLKCTGLATSFECGGNKKLDSPHVMEARECMSKNGNGVVGDTALRKNVDKFGDRKHVSDEIGFDNVGMNLAHLGQRCALV